MITVLVNDFNFFNTNSEIEKELTNFMERSDLVQKAESTVVPIQNVSGSIFFDFNGNGVWDEKEPPLENIGICVLDTHQSWVCTQTDQTGEFKVNGTSDSRDVISLKFEYSNLGKQAAGFRFISINSMQVKLESYEYDGETLPIQELWDSNILPITSEFEINNNEKIEIGIMQGILTLPFESKLNNEIEIYSYVDLDDRPGNYVRNYLGSTVLSAGFPFEPFTNGTGPAHEGIDYLINSGTEILAAAPGVVLRVGDFTNCSGALSVEILHAEGLVSLYTHFSNIFVVKDQKVYRGEIIGLSGNSGNCSLGPHLHFGLLSPEKQVIDPYRDEKNLDGSPGYWTVDNNPQFTDSYY